LESLVTHDRTTPESEARKPYQKALANSYYALLGVHPSASAREIRQAYRELSKQYHPDTTTLPQATATVKFQELNEAYATLSSPERRSSYDQKIGYSRLTVIQPLPNLNQTGQSRYKPISNAYLDPTDRPLSPGEIFALFILGLTFIGCLVLAITIGLTRGEDALAPTVLQPPPAIEIQADASERSSPEVLTSETEVVLSETAKSTEIAKPTEVAAPTLPVDSPSDVPSAKVSQQPQPTPVDSPVPDEVPQPQTSANNLASRSPVDTAPQSLAPDFPHS
jgi:hypothetical protein